MEEIQKEPKKSLNFEEFWAAVASVATRIGQNPLDEKWILVKGVVSAAWIDLIQPSLASIGKLTKQMSETPMENRDIEENGQDLLNSDPTAIDTLKSLAEIEGMPQFPASIDINSKEGNPLHLSIRLLELGIKKPVCWGSAVAINKEFAVAIHNPSETKRIRVICHVCDRNDKRLNTEGKMVLDLDVKDAKVMLKFKTDISPGEGPIQLHFLAAELPLEPGTPLYHTRLFLNIVPGGENMDVMMDISPLEESKKED